MDNTDARRGKHVTVFYCSTANIGKSFEICKCEVKKREKQKIIPQKFAY